MISVKDSLRITVDLVSDVEALRILTFIEQMRKYPKRSLTLKRLAGDPAFRIPRQKTGTFARVDPVEGSGPLASRMLVEDRR